jgi:hypothetical protein
MFGMEIGGRTDDYRVDARVGKHRIEIGGAVSHTEFTGECLRLIGPPSDDSLQRQFPPDRVLLQPLNRSCVFRSNRSRPNESDSH